MATYGGDANFDSSTSKVVKQVVQRGAGPAARRHGTGRPPVAASRVGRGELLCIKAPLKVTIDYADRGSFVDEFESYMKAFDHHVRGEQYLLVEMAPGPSDQAYLYEVQKDGRQSSVKFSPLSLQGAMAA